MKAPIIRFYKDGDMSSSMNQLMFSSKEGTYEPIAIGSKSVPVVLYITNNVKEGSSAEDVYDAKDCRLEVRDINSSTFGSTPIKERWLSAINRSINDNTEWVSMGGMDPEAQNTLPIGTVEGFNVLSGKSNNGNMDDVSDSGAFTNSCQIEMELSPPANTEAHSGTQTFDLYLSYSYGI